MMLLRGTGRVLRHLRAFGTVVRPGGPCVFNSLSGQIEPIETSAHQKTITWYSCGPTVYDAAHLGHARTYVCTDILRRVMRHAFNIETHLVMGVTDVDDKIIKRSSERKENGRPVTNVEFLKLARSYENDFFADLDLLGVLRPTAVARVSEHIEEIVDYIRTICDNGHGYEADDGVYFDCDSLRVAGHGSYGALARSAADVSSASSTVSKNLAHREKKNRRDFALWKKTDPSTTPGWDSPWGFGRPGWHIECSAMTHTLMGPHLDIHSGGIDLKFPHHNNEVAQCQAHNKCQAHEWTNQFVHFGHLHIDGLKMSKSLKNFVTVRDLFLPRGGMSSEVSHDPDDFRMFCLLHHYRSNVTYSEDRIRDARSVRRTFERFVDDMNAFVLDRRAVEEEPVDSMRTNVGAPDTKKWSLEDREFHSNIRSSKDAFFFALANDFDTPEAIQILRTICNDTRKHLSAVNPSSPSELVLDVVEFVRNSLQNTGLRVSISPENEACNDDNAQDVVLETLEAFASFRSAIRAVAINFECDTVEKKALRGQLLQACDEIRDVQFPSLGYELRDVASGGPNSKSAIRKL